MKKSPRGSNPVAPARSKTERLNLNTSGIGRDITKAVVFSIISEHRGIARCFSVSSSILNDDSTTLDGWFRSPALDNLQELDVSFRSLASPRPQVPHSTLRFSSTLRAAKFNCCRFRDDTARQINFPKLQHLELGSVTISGDSLHAMLAGSPVLDKFELM
jgi:hypothetical protein